MSELVPPDAETDGPTPPKDEDRDEPDAAGDEPSNVVPFPSQEEPAVEPAPAMVSELADACVRFVERALTVRLDFQPETLAVLDHYLTSRRDELRTAMTSNPEMVSLVARAAAAYFGEVVRRRFRSFWSLPSDDPATWEIRFEAVYLSFGPLAVVYDAISHGDEEGPIAHLELEEDDREAVGARLQELPLASDEEFFALGTRLEVLEIAVDVVKARMMNAGLGDVGFVDTDYDD